MSTGLLASYWYFKKFDFTSIPASVPLILDSGAFSAYTCGGSVDIEEFGAWLEQVRRVRPVDFAFTLDVLGDHEASLRNWEWLHERGHDTTPVIHYGQRADEVLPDYLERGVDRIALGGLASGGVTPQVRGWVAHMFRWLRDNAPEVKTHGLGIHIRSALSRFPWDTTDSSRCGTAWRYGVLNLWDFKSRRWHSVRLDGRALYRHGSLIRAYGFEPEKVAKADSGTYFDIVRLVTVIEQRAAEDYRPPRGQFVAQPERSLVLGEPRSFAVAGAVLGEVAGRYPVDASFHQTIADTLIQRTETLPIH